MNVELCRGFFSTEPSVLVNQGNLVVVISGLRRRGGEREDEYCSLLVDSVGVWECGMSKLIIDQMNQAG